MDRDLHEIEAEARRLFPLLFRHCGVTRIDVDGDAEVYVSFGTSRLQRVMVPLDHDWREQLVNLTEDEILAAIRDQAAPAQAIEHG